MLMPLVTQRSTIFLVTLEFLDHGNAWRHGLSGSRDLFEAFDNEPENFVHIPDGVSKDAGNGSWKRALPHVLVAIISSFLFGYHLRVVNETLQSMSIDLGFHGDTLAEGLVVSTCLGGAFFWSLVSGSNAVGLGRCRAFQLCAMPMIIGALIRKVHAQAFIVIEDLVDYGII